MSAFIQIPLAETPHGIAFSAVLLDATPQSLSEDFGLLFERRKDDLDCFDAAVLKLDKGSVIGLRYYLNAPLKGVEVIISESSTAPLADLESVLAAFGEKLPGIVWKHPDLENGEPNCLQFGAGSLDRE